MIFLNFSFLVRSAPNLSYTSQYPIMLPGFRSGKFYDFCINDDSSLTCFGLRNTDSITDCIKSKNCKVLLIIQKTSAAVTFTLISPTTTNTWFALGISKDDRMGEDLVFSCWVRSNESVELVTSWNQGHENIKADILPAPRMKKSFFIESHAACEWSLPESFVIRWENKQLNKQIKGMLT